MVSLFVLVQGALCRMSTDPGTLLGVDLAPSLEEGDWDKLEVVACGTVSL